MKAKGNNSWGFGGGGWENEEMAVWRVFKPYLMHEKEERTRKKDV